MTRSNNYRTNYSSISATETKIVSPKNNFCRQRMIDMRRYRNKLLIFRARPQLKKQYQWSLWRFILHILLLIKQYSVKQIVYFHINRYVQERYRIYTAYIPVNTLDDW